MQNRLQIGHVMPNFLVANTTSLLSHPAVAACYRKNGVRAGNYNAS
jgi:hypothetical protein